jgi:hypothetical protein
MMNRVYSLKDEFKLGFQGFYRESSSTKASPLALWEGGVSVANMILFVPMVRKGHSNFSFKISLPLGSSCWKKNLFSFFVAEVADKIN